MDINNTFQSWGFGPQLIMDTKLWGKKKRCYSTPPTKTALQWTQGAMYNKLELGEKVKQRNVSISYFLPTWIQNAAAAQ